jgi:hypothetical protein
MFDAIVIAIIQDASKPAYAALALWAVSALRSSALSLVIRRRQKHHVACNTAKSRAKLWPA